MQDDHTAVRARVTGRVQGVSFRVWVRSEAEALGLAGWVRNEPDGSVTALIAGPEAQVSRMLDTLWRGPRAALVANVATEKVEPGEPLAGFRITG